MAFPTIPTVAAGRVLTVNQADTSGTRTFPNLSSLTKDSGDLLVAIIVCYQSSLTSAIFSSWGAGFTELKDIGVASQHAVGIAYKWSDGTETGTFTVAQGGTVTGHASMALLSIPGVHPSEVPAVLAALATGTTSAANPGTLTPSWGAEDTLWISIIGSGMTSGTGSWTGTVATAPTNYGDRVDSNTTDNSTVGQTELAVAFRQLNASSEDVGTGSCDTSNARNCATVIAIRPAPPAATELAPDPVTLPIATPAPTVALSYALAPTPATVPLSVPAPTIAHALALTPSPVTLPLVVPDPTVVVDRTLTPDPVVVPLTVAAPSIALSLGLSPDPVAVPLVAPAPTVALGALTITPGPVAVPLIVPDPNVGREYRPDPVELPFVIPAPTVGVEYRIAPVEIPFVVPAVTVDVSAGPTSITPDPVTLPLLVASPTLSLSLSLTLDPASSPLVVPAVTVDLSLTLTPSAVEVPLVVPAPSVAVAGGAQTISPDPVAVPLLVVAPALDFGPITISPDPVTVPMLLAAPSIAHVLELVLEPAAVVFVIPAPTLGGTGTNIAPDPVVLLFLVPDVSFRPPGKPDVVVGDARIVGVALGDAPATATMTGDSRKVLVEVGDG